MNVQEFEELIKLRNRIREEIYIRLAADMSNNKDYDDLFKEAHRTTIYYIKNATILTDEELDKIAADTTICY